MRAVYFAVMAAQCRPPDEGTGLTASKQWEPTGTQFNRQSVEYFYEPTN